VSSAVLFHPYPEALSQESCRPQGVFICIPWHIVLLLKVRKYSTSAEIFHTFWTCSTNRDNWVCTYLRSTSLVSSLNLRTDEQTDEIPFRPCGQMTRRDDIEKSRSSVRLMSSYGQTIANPVDRYLPPGKIRTIHRPVTGINLAACITSIIFVQKLTFSLRDLGGALPGGR